MIPEYYSEQMKMLMIDIQVWVEVFILRHLQG